MGGISRTASYKGKRINVGGHGLFSKPDRAMEWWLWTLRLEASENSQTSSSATVWSERLRPPHPVPARRGGLC